MKILSEYTDLSIPEYALSYLVNGDTSGIDEQDKHIIDAYMQEFYNEAKEANGSLIFSTDSDESFFTWYPEFGNACMCEYCTILILVDDSQEEKNTMKFNSTDIGCYGDSARGIYLDIRIVEFAIAHGFTLDQSDPDNTLGVDNEFLGEIADEAIEYLNSITDTSAALWGYSDNGDFGLWELDAE